MNDSFMDKTSNNDLKEFLEFCSKFIDFDIDSHYDATLKYVKNFDNPKNELPKEISDMFGIWYNSLPSEKYEYDVYNSSFYLCEAWLCWKKYSSRYLKDFKKKNVITKTKTLTIHEYLSGVESIADLGCGFAYTTASFVELFPTASVYGTNFEQSAQFRTATELGKKIGFSIKPDIQGHSDLIFASEYFEHIERPIEHLKEVISTCSPKFLIIANAFGQKAIGHFTSYKDGDKVYTPKDISKMFNKTLRDLGYRNQKTDLWNKRPAIWALEEQPDEQNFLTLW